MALFQPPHPEGSIISPSFPISINTHLVVELLGGLCKESRQSTDPKHIRDIQDLTQKLMEGVIAVIGGAIEDPTGTTEGDEAKMKSIEKRRKVALKAVIVLTMRLPIIIGTIFKGRSLDRINTLISQVVKAVMPFATERSNMKLEELTVQSVRLFNSLCRIKVGNMIGSQGPSFVWQKEIMAVFYDYSFFKVDEKQIKIWSNVINRLVKEDPTLFQEFIKILSHAIAHTSSNNIFLHPAKIKEENLNRAKNLKRLAFLIFCGDYDQYLDQVPVIQEKLVEAMKAKGEPEIISILKQYVFLVLRVMLLRITPKKVDPFWPVVLTEIIDIYSNQHDDYLLVFALTKYLDLLLLLPNETNMWQWIFIRDQFCPIMGQVVERGRRTGNGMVNVDIPVDGQLNCFIPFFDRLAPPVVSDEIQKPEKKRPIITLNNLSTNDGPDFIASLPKFGQSWYQNAVSGIDPDREFIENFLTLDFCERRPSQLLQPQQQPQQQDDNGSNWLFV